MGVENRIENLGEEEYRSLGKMLQGLLRETDWTRSLAYLKTSDGFLNLVKIG
jgi:hypothetical protein